MPRTWSGLIFPGKAVGQHLALCRVIISAITDPIVVQILRYAFQLLTAAWRLHQEESGWMRHLLWFIFSDTVWSVAVQVSWTKEQMVASGLNEYTGRPNLEETVLNFHLSQIKEEGNQWVINWMVPVCQSLGCFFSLLGYIAGNIQQSVFWSFLIKTCEFCWIKGYFALFFENWGLSSTSWLFLYLMCISIPKVWVQSSKVWIEAGYEFCLEIITPDCLMCAHNCPGVLLWVWQTLHQKHTSKPDSESQARRDGATLGTSLCKHHLALWDQLCCSFPVCSGNWKWSSSKHLLCSWQEREGELPASCTEGPGSSSLSLHLQTSMGALPAAAGKGLHRHVQAGEQELCPPHRGGE